MLLVKSSARASPLGPVGAAFYLCASNEIHRAGDSGAIGADQLRMNRTIDADPQKGVSMLPVDLGGERIGSLGLCGAPLSETVLKSIASLVSVVLERVQASEKLLAAKRVHDFAVIERIGFEAESGVLELRARGDFANARVESAADVLPARCGTGDRQQTKAARSA